MKTIVVIHCSLALLVAGPGSIVHAVGETNTTRLAGTQEGPAGASQRPSAVPALLSDEQQASWRVAREAQAEATRDLNNQLQLARKELVEAGLMAPFDETRVREKAQAVGKLEAELAVLRAKAFSKIKPPLTPEQIAKMKQTDPAPGVRPVQVNRRPPTDSAPGQDRSGTPPKQ